MLYQWRFDASDPSHIRIRFDGRPATWLCAGLGVLALVLPLLGPASGAWWLWACGGLFCFWAARLCYQVCTYHFDAPNQTLHAEQRRWGHIERRDIPLPDIQSIRIESLYGSLSYRIALGLEGSSWPLVTAYCRDSAMPAQARTLQQWFVAHGWPIPLDKVVD